MGSADFFALDALTMVLSHGRGARLPQRIVNRGLAVEAWAYNPDNRFGGMVILGGSPTTGSDDGEPSAAKPDDRRALYLQACEKLEAVLLEQVALLKTEPVSDRELERIKKINQRDFLDRMRSNEDLAGTLATLEVQIGWRYLNDYLARIATVSAEDIQRAARRYLQEENKTSVYVIPGGSPDQPPASYSEERTVSSSFAARTAVSTDRQNHSDFPTPAGWQHPLSFNREPHRIAYPAAERLTISGAEVFFIQDAEVPLIDASFLVKAGAVDLDETQAGLSGLLNAALIRGGTERYSPTELATVLDENGIRISVNVAEEDTTIRLSVLRDDWEKGLDILAELLTRPRLDPQVLEAARTQMLMRLDRQAGDAQAVAFRESMIKRFPDHPYGRDPLAAREVLPKLSADDIKTFIDTHVVPVNLKAAVSGDIDSPRVVEGLKRFFDQLPQTPPPPRRLPEPQRAPAQMTLIHKPGQVQSQVVLTLPGPKRIHPDYWKSSLLMSVFGGSDSLMYKRLRDDLGLVYSAGFYQTYKWQTGLLVGYIGCKGDKTADAISETVKIMSALRKEVPAAEFSRKRLDALNSFVFNVDTKSDLVEVYSRYALRGEPLDTLDSIQDAFFDAHLTDLQRIAGERLLPADIQITIVGDKEVAVRQADGSERALASVLQDLALELGIPFQELPLR
jgi:zinc protease